MADCTTNSSNISGHLTVNNFNNVGARLIVPISLSGFSGGAGGDSTWKSEVGDPMGVTVGDVVFYDARVGSPSEGKFTTSIANSAETSEVFGVIESADGDIANVVMYGQINYPMNKAHYDQLAFSGASGGNDVFFLSAVTAGLLSNIAPLTVGHIAKPILTGATLGNYNAIVNNYIGYAVGGAVAAQDVTSGTVGSLNYVPEGTDTSTMEANGYIRADEVSAVSVSDYPDYYSLVGERYGSEHEIIFSNDTPVDLADSNKSLSQTLSSTKSVSSVVRSLDLVNNKITVKYDPGDEKFEIGDAVVGGRSVKIATSTVKHVYLPKYPVRKESVKDSSGKFKTVNQIPFIKVSAVVGVSIPQNLTVTNLNITGKLTASSSEESTTYDDLVAQVKTLKADVATLQSKVIG
tara:strand:- start:8960 stop:10177 length:1218 start_codon:yes stop_codon:yes gene_type:complete